MIPVAVSLSLEQSKKLGCVSGNPGEWLGSEVAVLLSSSFDGAMPRADWANRAPGWDCP